MVFALFIVFLLSGIFYYFYHRNQQLIETNKVVYNSITQKWEKFAKEDPLEEDRKPIIDNTDNTNGTHNQSVLKGYFESYDETKQILTFKSVVSFTQNNLFETVELKLLPNQIIYCAPSIYTDSNTGKSYSIDKLVVPVKDGDTLWIPTEKIINFEEFLTQSKENTFVYLQLTKNYDKQTDNYIKKLIVIGLCE